MMTIKQNPYRFELEERAFREGYFLCGDDIMNWINSCDSSEMTITDFRSALWHHILDARPNYTKYKYGESQ